MMKIYRKSYLLAVVLFHIAYFLNAQGNNKLELFKLNNVELKESVFEKAMYTDLDYMMKMDPDRLLAPFLTEAGLQPKAENYPNWENSGLNGHIGGHYLTALAQMYASSGSHEAKERLDYMIMELKRAQDANGNGYVGGIPDGKRIWGEIAKGNIDASSFGLNGGWVPLYNIHKTYAGLRDAYLIAGSTLAKKMLIDLTDWMIATTRELTDEQIQDMLRSEHGGLNEIFANVYTITGDKKYLDLAYRFSQKELEQPLAEKEDILNGMHANTQIPKVIGFETIAEADGNTDFHEAAAYFWDNVVTERTISIGGNSVREHFNPADDFSSMITSEQGPETCNTYNMLKLSEKLFLNDRDEKYMEYYERALYNHILSSQNPEGGFVYFTPMRPQHYRVYSQPETSFWCCVGSGLENHGKYNEMIYAHNDSELYVNLFIPSKLDWQEKDFQLLQQTDFPQSETSTLSIQTKKPQQIALNIRYPFWAEGEYEILVNNKQVKFDNKPGSYVSINRTWKTGDEIKIVLPMQLSAVKLPDGSTYESLQYGPIVLGAKTGDQDMKGMFANDSRGGHIAEGKKIPLSESPIFLTKDDKDFTAEISKEVGDSLQFSAKEVMYPPKFENLKFVPFYEIHNARYVVYLPVETPESLAIIAKQRKEEELAEQALDKMTVDIVNPGEQQPESDHFIKMENSNTGINIDRHWRDATGWFSYELQDKNNEAQKVSVTYFGQDNGREFKIMINGFLLAEEKFNGKKGNIFFTKEYLLPKKYLEENKTRVSLRFEAEKGSRTAGVYEVRLLKATN